MGLKANNSFGFGDVSNGGGGGEVNTASNVGVGAQVFKQKVGSDLEFRTLLPNGTSVNNAFQITQDTDTITLEVITDSFGISNAQGYYTFYSNLSAAIAAANVGETVVLFDDIIEPLAVQVVLKDGVNINLNGHSYTFTFLGLENAFIDNAVTVKCKILNGTIIRQNGARFQFSFGGCLKVDNVNSQIILDNVKCQNLNGGVLYTEGTVIGGFFESIFTGRNNTFFVNFGIQVQENAKLINATIIGNTNTLVRGQLKSCYVFSSGFTTDTLLQRAVFIGGSGNVDNCIIESELGIGIEAAEFSSITNSTVNTFAQIGINCRDNVKIFNTYVKSISNIALIAETVNQEVVFANSVFESDTLNAATIRGFVVNNCVFISNENFGLSIQGGKLNNCNVISKSPALNHNAIRVLTKTLQDLITEIANCNCVVANPLNSAIRSVDFLPPSIKAVMNTATISQIMFENVINIQSFTSDAYGNIIVG